MAHGAPDWGVFGKLSTVHRVNDLGELAARIAVVNTFDRRGNVVWWDDFEDNINKWSIVIGGNGAAAVLSTDDARSGAKSCKITTGDAIGNLSYIKRAMGLPTLTTKVGVEVSFMFDGAMVIRFTGQVFKQGRRYTASIRYLSTLDKLQYQSSLAAWFDIASGIGLALDPVWHTLKIVFDTTGSGEYTRVILDNTTYDVSGEVLTSIASAEKDQFQVYANAEAEVGANYNLYVDDVIITQNEP